MTLEIDRVGDILFNANLLILCEVVDSLWILTLVGPSWMPG